MTDKSVEKWPSWCSVLSGGAKQKSARNVVSVGSLCNNDYDGNESVQKVTGLISKTTIMHALVTSLFHCCRSMTKTWNVLTRRFKQPEKTVDILRRHHWFPRENDVWATSVEIPFWWRASLPTSGDCFWLVEKTSLAARPIRGAMSTQASARNIVSPYQVLQWHKQ